jgi:hypothetical protein
MLVKVDTPQRGDIIFYASPPNTNNHSAIVKVFDGTRSTLIEQNFKWAQNGGPYTYLNRTIDWSPGGNDYEIWRYSPAPAQTDGGALTEAGPQPDGGVLTGLLGYDLYPSSSADGGDGSPGLIASQGDTGYGDSPPPVTEPETPLEAPPVTEPEVLHEAPPITEPEVLQEAPPVTEPLQFVEPYGPAPVFEAFVTIGGDTINVNGWDMPIDAPALIENNRAVLPVRFVGYALGLDSDDIAWDAATRTVSVFNNGNVIDFEVDSDVLFVNGHPIQMDCPAFIRNDYTYLPLKYLAEALNACYEWDEGQRTVRLFR